MALGALGTSIARIGHLRAVAAHRQLKSACGLSIALAVGVGLSALAVCVAFECPRCRVRSVAVRAEAVRARQQRLVVEAAVARVATSTEMARGGDIGWRGSEESGEEGGEGDGNEGISATGVGGDEEGIGGGECSDLWQRKGRCIMVGCWFKARGWIACAENKWACGNGAPATFMGRATSRSCRCRCACQKG